MSEQAHDGQPPMAAQADRETTEARKIRVSDELEERFGRPLERERWGEYLAVSPSGETLLGPDLDELSQRVVDVFGLGKGIHLFKVGDIAVWRFRDWSEINRALADLPDPPQDQKRS